MRFVERGYETFPNVYKQVEVEYAKQAVEHICRTIRPEDLLWQRKIVSLVELGEHRHPCLRNGPKKVGQIESDEQTTKNINEGIRT